MRPIAILVAMATLLAACGENPLPFLPSSEPTPVQPREVPVVVVARGSAEPVANAAIEVGDETATTGDDGRATVTALPGDEVAVTADGFDPGQAEVAESGELTIELRSNVLTGVVTDEDGEPLAGAKVFVDGQETVALTDEDGAYRLPGVPESGTAVVKMPGFRLADVALDGQMVKDVSLEPFEVRALYAPGAVFEGAGRLEALLAMLDRTEANAMVIDVKETGGYLYYETDLPEAKESGADRRPIFNLEELLPALKERGIYLIARMVVMKDNTVGASRPELAVRNSATGEPWTDFGGGIWLDPFNPGVAEYIAAIAGDLADKGFDEVQLDYVRFFSDGDYSVAETNLPNTQSFRLPAIRRLFRLVSDRLAAERAFLAADVFPISFIALDDQGIGQRPEVIMPYVDYFCPMVYPSHYGFGTFGIAQPNEQPYEIIDKTLEIMNRQSAALPMKIRPWIQDFGYGEFRAYTATDIKAEMKALDDNDAHGWMIWNARAIFTEAALGDPRPNEDAGATTGAAAPSPSDDAGDSATPAASPGS